MTDCRLLLNYYKSDPATWTQEKQTAVEGYTPGTCRAWDRSFIDVIVAANARGCGIPADQVYDPVKNPKGVRCTMWDTNVATFGRDPATGFARRSLDNVGVQYGLDALNRGAITPAEFLDLNEKIGGFDNDGIAARRAQRRRSRVAAADLRGRAAQLRRRRPRRRRRSCTYRSYNDASATSTIASATSRVRERLRKANGRVDNQVIWVYPNGVAGPRPEGRRAGHRHDGAVARRDRDATRRPARRSRRSSGPSRRPPSTAAGMPRGTRIDEAATFDGPGRCNTLFPNHKNPRLVAGAPVADDITKCAAEADRRARLQGGLLRRPRCRSCARCSPAACATTRSPASTRCRSPAPISNCRCPLARRSTSTARSQQ